MCNTRSALRAGAKLWRMLKNNDHPIKEMPRFLISNNIVYSVPSQIMVRGVSWSHTSHHQLQPSPENLCDAVHSEFAVPDSSQQCPDTGSLSKKELCFAVAMECWKAMAHLSSPHDAQPPRSPSRAGTPEYRGPAAS